MWQLVLALLLMLGAFTLCIRLSLSTFQRTVAQATDQQARILSSLLSPLLNPPSTPVVEQEQPEPSLPVWLEGADSLDLMEGRVTDWEMPEITDEDSVSPEM